MAWYQRVANGIVHWFFAYFFRLLIGAISAAEWYVGWWICRRPAALPWLGHVAGIALVYGINRWLVMRTRTPGLAQAGIQRLPRLYYATAFTCLFATLFLLLDNTAWAFARALSASISGPVMAAQGSSVDRAFVGLGDLGVFGIAVAFAYGYTYGQRRLVVRAMDVECNDPALRGVRMTQLSDIHIGQNLNVPQLEEFVERANQVGAEIICITGDVIDSPAADLEKYLPILGRLRANHGIYVILGNHDHYAGADRVAAALAALPGFTVLRDAQTTVTLPTGSVHIIGLDDRGRDWARGLTHVPELEPLLAQAPSGVPMVLLSHRPDVFPQAADAGVVLTLAGHTHGGQLGIGWPGGRIRNLAEFITAYDRGLFRQSNSYLYVNCGLGVTGQRIRLCTPREISVFRFA